MAKTRRKMSAKQIKHLRHEAPKSGAQGQAARSRKETQPGTRTSRRTAQEHGPQTAKHLASSQDEEKPGASFIPARESSKKE